MPEWHTETLQLTFILQLLAWYIKYQLTYSTVTYSPNCWHRIFNTKLHLYKCTFPQTPSILDSSHICCHDTADLNVQCTLYNVQCTTDIYSPYCDAFVHFTFHNNLKVECIRYIESWVTVEVNTSITPISHIRPPHPTIVEVQTNPLCGPKTTTTQYINHIYMS